MRRTGVVLVALAVMLVAVTAVAQARTATAPRVSVERCAFRSYAAPLGPARMPAAMTATVPASLAGRLRVYWAPFSAAVGPAGMRCDATEGGDGTVLTRIRPPAAGRRGPGVTAYVVPGCAGCRADLACPYFRALARLATGRCAVPRRERVLARTRHTVRFEDPPGVGGNGQDAGGRLTAVSMLVYVPDTASAQGIAAMATCRLPARQRELCRAVLTDFARRVGG